VKFIDLSNGLRTQVSNEESMLIKQIKDHGNSIRKKVLGEREAQVASELCKRGVLTRTKVKGKIHYVADDSHAIWRL
jgi:hypothetical protein